MNEVSDIDAVVVVVNDLARDSFDCLRNRSCLLVVVVVAAVVAAVVVAAVAVD